MEFSNIGIGDSQQKLRGECVSADCWAWYLTWDGQNSKEEGA